MKIIISLILLILGALALPAISYAAIDVTFETTPLFGQANFLPGDTVVRTVTVTNTGDVTEQVYTQLLNVADGGLAPMLTIKITDPTMLFDGSFNDLDTANKQFLSSLASGETKIYTFAMYFLPQAGNEYQLKSLGFDLCVGISGGQFECDSDDVPDGGGGGGGNGGSGGNGNSSEPDGEVLGVTSPAPRILGEQVSVIPIGAPDTGVAYKTVSSNTLGIIVMLLTSLVGLRYVYTRSVR